MTKNGLTCSSFVIVYRMNDPHVETLFYRIDHSEGVDYSKVPPLELPEPKFTIYIKNESARIDMRDHYSAEQDARDIVEPFLCAWELSAALNRNPGEWQFVYDRANVIDRNPPPGTVLSPAAGRYTLTGGSVNSVVSATYPPPPVGIACDAAVDFMFYHYRKLREGHESIAYVANCCLTMLEFRAGNREAASHRFGISSKVLDKFGYLLANKGGIEARKAKAAQVDFTSAEQEWLTKLIPILIRRAAEAAFDAAVCGPQITMADLPPLS
jgi:hypothetical protein